MTRERERERPAKFISCILGSGRHVTGPLELTKVKGQRKRSPKGVDFHAKDLTNNQSLLILPHIRCQFDLEDTLSIYVTVTKVLNIRIV